jgi:PIN domain nuclease of toxin-antitoxin system
VNAVLDASALLAWLQAEPGAESVEAELATAAISSLNWSEVLQKSLAHGVEIAGLREDLEALGLAIVPFDAVDAEQAARLWAPGNGLSLADRACLALGVRLRLPVWTADRMWAQLSPGVTVHVIRG